MDKYTGFPSTQCLQWRRRHKTQDPGHEAWDYSEWIFSNIGPSLGRALEPRAAVNNAGKCIRAVILHNRGPDSKTRPVLQPQHYREIILSKHSHLAFQILRRVWCQWWVKRRVTPCLPRGWGQGITSGGRSRPWPIRPRTRWGPSDDWWKQLNLFN